MPMARIIEKTTTITREIELAPLAPGETQQERILTVQEGKTKGASQLQLSGVWLSDASFHPGDKALISVYENRLVIEKLDAKGEDRHES